MDTSLTVRRFQRCVDSLNNYLAPVPCEWSNHVRNGSFICENDFVLFALASHMNKDTRTAYCDFHRLKAETGLGQSTIESCIARLESWHWLKVEHEKISYGRTRNAYHFIAAIEDERFRPILFDAAFLHSGFFSLLSDTAKRLWIAMTCYSKAVVSSFDFEFWTFRNDEQFDVYRSLLKEGFEDWRLSDFGFVPIAASEQWINQLSTNKKKLRETMQELKDYGLVYDMEDVFDYDEDVEGILEGGEEGWLLIRRPMPPSEPAAYAKWERGIALFQARVDARVTDNQARKDALKAALKTKSAPAPRTRRGVAKPSGTVQ